MTDKLIMTTKERDLIISAVRIGQQLNDDRANELHQDELSVLRDAIAMLQSLPMVSTEPVAYRLPEPDVDKKHYYFDLDEVEPVNHVLEALYTSPQALTPLTAELLDDDEWESIWIECSGNNDDTINMSVFAEKVQQAFCEKNGIKHRSEAR